MAWAYGKLEWKFLQGLTKKKLPFLLPQAHAIIFTGNVANLNQFEVFQEEVFQEFPGGCFSVKTLIPIYLRPMQKSLQEILRI